MKIRTIALVSCLLPIAAQATETDYHSLRANFRRVALEMASTEVQNAKYYSDNPNSQLSADSQTMIKGVMDFVLEYEQPQWQWNNSLFAEYGRTKLRPNDGETTTSEDSDKILLTTDYNRKMWRFEKDNADVGPFASLAYQTEFKANKPAPLQKIIRGKSGLKIFNGTIIKELYAAAVGEYDMTYSDDETFKSAYEIGWRTEYAQSEQVKFQLEGYFRDYLSYSEYVATDLKYELSATARMDVKIHNDFSLAPYVQYFQGEARGVGKTGSNFMIGLSFAYSGLFNL
ncbi:MAG: DUF3078 domain-containing protein [Alphaproteobacteria bacterium]|nr:DUF3078 domain-containing protein [Alphaproteobacteria bacterium]